MWCTNIEHDGRKHLINGFLHSRIFSQSYTYPTFQFYWEERIHQHINTQLEMYTYCSINKQYVEEVQKWKKITWWCQSKVMWFYSSLFKNAKRIWSFLFLMFHLTSQPTDMLILFTDTYLLHLYRTIYSYFLTQISVYWMDTASWVQIWYQLYEEYFGPFMMPIDAFLYFE